MSSFKSHFHKQAGNIERCTELKAKSKKDFFDAMERVGDDSIALRAKAGEYFRQRKFGGGKVNLGKEARLGRIHQWTAIADAFQKANGGNFNPGDDPELKGPRQNFEAGDAAEKANVINDVLEFIPDLPFGPLVWAFLFADEDRPFVSRELAELPCRLGLEYLEASRYFPIELSIPVTADVRKPTAFDAGLDEYWCPGGRTCPRAECAGRTGFEEVVAQGYDKTARPNGLTFSHAKAPNFNYVSLVTGSKR